MRCLSPESIQRPQGRGSKDRITVPCGKCYACISNKREQWAFRLEQEYKANLTAHFITLTYDDEHLTFTETGFTLLKTDVQLFLKRLRANYSRPNVMRSLGYQGSDLSGKSKIRYFIIGEYGSQTLRPHYHGLFFGLPVNPRKLLLESWKMGLIHIGTVSSKSIRYCTRYMLTKHDEKNEVLPEFSIMSRRPGIGADYFKNAGQSHVENNIQFGVTGGHKVCLPAFYRNRMFNETKRSEKNEEIRKKYERENDLKREWLKKIEHDLGSFEIAQKESYKKSIKKTLEKKSKL